MKQSLMRKLVSIMILITLVPMAALSTYFLYQSRTDALSGQAEASLNLTKSVAHQIDEFVAGNVNIIKVVSQLESVRQLDSAEGEKDLTALIREVPQFALIFVTDQTGMQIARSDGRAQKDSLADRAYFSPVMSGETVVSDVLISKTTGKPSVVIAVPIKSGDKVVGMAGGTLDLSQIKNIAGSYTLGETGFISVYDSKGSILVHKDEALEAERSDQSQLSYVQKALQGSEGNEESSGGGSAQSIAYTQASLVKWPVVAQQPASEVVASVNQSMIVSTIGIVLGMAVIIALAVWISRQLLKPINQLVQEVLEASKGDFTRTIQIRSSDEIGHLGKRFNEMLRELQTLLKGTAAVIYNVSEKMKQLKDGSAETHSGAMEISTSMDSLSVNMKKQTENTEEVFRTAGLMLENTRQIGTAIEEISQNAVQTAFVAEKGDGALKHVIHLIDEMTQVSNNTSAKVGVLTQRSQEIGNIVQIMSEIASQTNLLALNAAIEAARAGEQGRGFAVVADEVLKLAEQSSQAAGEIGKLIHSIQMEMDEIVVMINQGSSKISEGTTAVSDFEQTIIQLTDSSQALAAQVEEVNASVQELAKGTEHVQSQMAETTEHTGQLNELVVSVAGTTDLQSQHMQEITGTVETITELFSTLDQSIKKFKLD